MNKLKRAKQIAAISALVEGNSIRATERMTHVHRDTIMRLLVRVGGACADLLDREMAALECRHIQMDEIWSYVGKKQARVRAGEEQEKGDMWTYVALDTDTKLVPAHRVGKRTTANTRAFVDDLAGRMRGKVQLSSDMLDQYVEAVEESFGADVDYGRIVKHYEPTPVGPGRYSPPRVSGITTDQITGRPTGICTSHVERQNLTMRMSMRRLTR